MKILIIDDDKFIRKTISTILQKEGYTVIEAKDGAEGLKLAKEVLPNLILCDIVMPGMDGFEVKKRISEIEELKGVPFIFLTSKSDLESRVEGFELGVDDYITKPFHPIEFLARIKAALKRAEAYMEISKIDPLTKILNRRGIFEFLDEALENARESGQKLSVAMADIDKFKSLNDTYGHLAGDAALTHLAGILKSNLPQGCKVGRYGGEEFLMVFPNYEKLKAFDVLEHIRRTVEDTPLNWGNTLIKFTISIGVAEFPNDAIERDELIAKADEALYEAKRTGRNKVVVYGGNKND
ncbi:MAG: diguanylate cyclase response regulator [Candidatus Hydrothermota bacterium]|nr:MAG: diguanylate cyclase response regulator [Candidatus Hydrothermae bacterium]